MGILKCLSRPMTSARQLFVNFTSNSVTLFLRLPTESIFHASSSFCNTLPCPSPEIFHNQQRNLEGQFLPAKFRKMSDKNTGILNWANETGQFVRKVSQFRDKISADGPYPPEAGRYHLYISLACPWAHRTLIVRQLKGLEEVIGLSVVNYLMGENGWEFLSAEEVPGCIPDSCTQAAFLKEIYFRSEPNYDGRYTVPVLYDKQTNRIVNNESSEIMRMFNSEFNSFAKNPKLDLYPASLRPRIDELNDIIYNGINNGVYRAGFATAQSAYEEGAKLVHKTLLEMDSILRENEFICGGALTETDVRLFTSIIRFDPVYHGHFKCNLITVRELENLSRWMFSILKLPGIKKTVNMEHIKKHYYMSHKNINLTGIVPLYDGPAMVDSN